MKQHLKEEGDTTQPREALQRKEKYPQNQQNLSNSIIALFSPFFLTKICRLQYGQT